MTKDVLVSISGAHMVDGDSDDVSVITAGSYFCKNGKHYGAYSGIALETQMFPDSPHHPSFPATLLKPGEVYRHKTVYSFNCFNV